MRSLTLWLPGRVPSPNQLWRLHPMRRAERVKAMRRRAFLASWSELNRRRMGTFTGPTRVHFEVRRVRLLDGDNLWSSVKAIRDGLCEWRTKRSVLYGILPLGDGPTSPYTFEVIQIRVAKEDEGVWIEVESLGVSGG